MLILRKRLFLTILLGALLIGAVWLNTNLRALAAATPNGEKSNPPKSVVIDLAPHAVFSFIGFDYKNDSAAKQARQIFQERAIPMAVDYGFQRYGALLVKAANPSARNFQGFLLSSWPNQAAFDAFERDPRWPQFDALRPQIWNDIRYYRDVQENGLKLELRDDKFYTLAVAHYNPENPGDYDRYLSSLEDEVAKNGGKFILKLLEPKLESFTNDPSPNQLTLIEWDEAEGVDRLLGSDVYKANQRYAASGTTRLAFYRLQPSF